MRRWPTAAWCLLQISWKLVYWQIVWLLNDVFQLPMLCRVEWLDDCANHELERAWKGEVVVYLRHRLRFSLEGREKSRKPQSGYLGPGLETGQWNQNNHTLRPNVWEKNQSISSKSIIRGHTLGWKDTSIWFSKLYSRCKIRNADYISYLRAFTCSTSSLTWLTLGTDISTTSQYTVDCRGVQGQYGRRRTDVRAFRDIWFLRYAFF
jgi:hypothetical protein